jgi:hypothetical protein
MATMFYGYLLYSCASALACVHTALQSLDELSTLDQLRSLQRLKCAKLSDMKPVLMHALAALIGDTAAVTRCTRNLAQ